MTATMTPHVLAPPVDERAARQTLRDQIARLDGELGELVLSAPWAAPLARESRRGRGGGATLLTLAQLKRARDELAARASAVRRALDARGEREEAMRRVREE